MEKAENVRVAESLLRVLSSWSVRFKYRAEDLFSALPYAMSLPASKVFENFDRINVNAQFLEELDEVMYLYKKLDDKGRQIVVLSVDMFNKLDKFEGRNFEPTQVTL